jgi:hypothetical protein
MRKASHVVSMMNEKTGSTTQYKACNRHRYLLGGTPNMSPQQLPTDQLKKAEASATLAKELIKQAMQECVSNQQVAEEALKQASTEVGQCQTMLSQAQSLFQPQAPTK